MADVDSKQQTTALFLSTIVTSTRRHTELTNLMGNLCCAREHSIQFFVQFFYTNKLPSLNYGVLGPLECMMPLGCMGPFITYTRASQMLFNTIIIQSENNKET